MDTKTKIFFAVFLMLLAGAVGTTYYRYFVIRDYMITAQAECDPSVEACFVSVCDPTVEECTGDPEEDTTYYAIISRNAKNIPLCDPADESCEALICPASEADCTITLCDTDLAEEGILCSDPAIYTSLHPEGESIEDMDGMDGEENTELGNALSESVENVVIDTAE